MSVRLLPRRRRNERGRWLLLVVLTTSLVVGTTALVAPMVRSVAQASVDAELPRLRFADLAARTVVLDRSGHPMATLYAENRRPVRLDDVSEVLVDAVLAAEDQRFFDHGGVDLHGIARAFRRNLGSGEVREGGSTITQQLVKNTLFERPRRDLSRKVREAVLALRLEDEHSKEQILEMYLNTVYFGKGAYGIASASERYFGKPPSELRLPEAALLAGLVASPEGRNPIDHPGAARRARDRVIDAMVKTGVATDDAALLAKQAPLPTALHEPPDEPLSGYFLEEVKRRLLADKRLGNTEQERFQRLFRGGLQITTTFDRTLQAYAEMAVRTIVPPGDFTASLVAIDNADGSVRAVVGGPDARTSPYNLATQSRRQTGSTFKAITLAAALRSGYSTEDLVDGSSPCTFRFGPHDPQWDVVNYDGMGGGTVTLARALAQSMNCAYARLALAITPERIVDTAKVLGLERDLEAVPSITLGSQSLSPLEMATMFSTFAADGMHHTPKFVTKVVAPDGTVLIDDTEPRGKQVLDPQIARTETAALRGVVEAGTGRAADIGRPAAGKTGTAENHRDAWFVGYVPQMTAAVWMGHRDAEIPMLDVGGRRVTGGSYPAQVWAAFMSQAMANEPVVDFVAPDPTRWPKPAHVTELGRMVYVPRPSPPPTVAPAPVPDPVTVPPPDPGKGKDKHASTTTTVAVTPTTTPSTTPTTTATTTVTTSPPTTTATTAPAG